LRLGFQAASVKAVTRATPHPDPRCYLPFRPAHAAFSQCGTVLPSYEEKILNAEEKPKENLIMATTTTSGFLLPASPIAVPAHGLHSPRPRRISREAGRALEMLAHAIEYLADEYVHHGSQLEGSEAQVRAMQILMALNREIYSECPETPTIEERVAAIFRRR
jgi:hypothetical protein